jgi:hypothetical protein
MTPLIFGDAELVSASVQIKILTPATRTREANNFRIKPLVHLSENRHFPAVALPFIG